MGFCPQSEKLPALVNGHLPDDEAATLRSHAAGCSACQALVARYERVATTLRSLPPLTAPPGLREHMLAQAAAAQSADRVRTRRLSLLAVALAAVLLAAVGGGVAYFGLRFRGLTPPQWLEAARKTANGAYSLRAFGWVETRQGRVPVEATRVAGSLTRRVGSRVEKLAGHVGFGIWDFGLLSDRPPIQNPQRLVPVTWQGAAGQFGYGEPLLLLAAPNARPTEPPRFHSRVPLVIAVPRAGSLVERIWIDPDSWQVRRAQLIGPDGRPRAALERLDYNFFFPIPGMPPPGRSLN
jgi:hypothetical protein